MECRSMSKPHDEEWYRKSRSKPRLIFAAHVLSNSAIRENAYPNYDFSHFPQLFFKKNHNFWAAQWSLLPPALISNHYNHSGECASVWCEIRYNLEVIKYQAWGQHKNISNQNFLGQKCSRSMVSDPQSSSNPSCPLFLHCIISKYSETQAIS